MTMGILTEFMGANSPYQRGIIAQIEKNVISRIFKNYMIIYEMFWDCLETSND